MSAMSKGFIALALMLLIAQSFAQSFVGFALSESVTITAIVPEAPAPYTPPPSTGGGGGGGGGGSNTNTGVPLSTYSAIDSAVFRGLAYPKSIITLLKNGVILTELPASPDGSFEIRVRNLPAGTYSFGIRAEDVDHLKSTLDLYTVYISSGVTTVIDGIFIPPTITTDYEEVKRGDIITLYGKTAPESSVTLSLHSAKEIIKKIKATANGVWIYKLDTNELEKGGHTGKVRSSTETDISLYSDPTSFTVGTVTKKRTASTSTTKNNRCDLNNDKKVNLLDFSILAFWYKRTGFPAKVDLNTDNKINLTDLSILAYCWTG
jgi:hypothetical protein